MSISHTGGCPFDVEVVGRITWDVGCFEKMCVISLLTNMSIDKLKKKYLEKHKDNRFII